MLKVYFVTKDGIKKVRVFCNDKMNEYWWEKPDELGTPPVKFPKLRDLISNQMAELKYPMTLELELQFWLDFRGLSYAMPFLVEKRITTLKQLLDLQEGDTVDATLLEKFNFPSEIKNTMVKEIIKENSKLFNASNIFSTTNDITFLLAKFGDRTLSIADTTEVLNDSFLQALEPYWEALTISEEDYEYAPQPAAALLLDLYNRNVTILDFLVSMRIPQLKEEVIKMERLFSNKLARETTAPI